MGEGAGVATGGAATAGAWITAGAAADGASGGAGSTRALSSTTMLGKRAGAGGVTTGGFVVLAVVGAWGGGATDGRTGAPGGAPAGGIPMSVGVRAVGAGRLARPGTVVGGALGGLGMLVPAGGGTELGLGCTGASSRTTMLRPVTSTGSLASSSSPSLASPRSMTSTREGGLAGASRTEPLLCGSSDCPDIQRLTLPASHRGVTHETRGVIACLCGLCRARMAVGARCSAQRALQRTREL